MNQIWKTRGKKNCIKKAHSVVNQNHDDDAKINMICFFYFCYLRYIYFFLWNLLNIWRKKRIKVKIAKENLFCAYIYAYIYRIYIMAFSSRIYPKLLWSTPWSKKTLTRFFSRSKTIAEIVLNKIDRDTSQVFNRRNCDSCYNLKVWEKYSLSFFRPWGTSQEFRVYVFVYTILHIVNINCILFIYHLIFSFY